MMTHLDHERSKQERIKCVVVGDSGVGKTRLICARARNAKFSLKELCSPHVPTVWAIDQYHQHQEVLENSWEVVDDVNVTLRLWDTFGCHDKDRKFAFGRSDVVALCFSVANPASLRHCVDKWWPEIRRFCPKIPIVLIGCRNDLRHLYKDPAYAKVVRDERKRVKEADILLPEKGRAVAAQIGAVAYYETSVLSGFGVRSVFTNCVRAALVHRRQTRFWASHLKHVRNAEFQSPYLIPAPPSPEQATTKSTLVDDLARLLVAPCATAPTASATEGAVFADVEMLCGDGVSVWAHRVLLAAASAELYKLLTSAVSEGGLSAAAVAHSGHTCFHEVLCAAEEPSGRSVLRVVLRGEFIGRCLEQLLHFLYLGVLDMTPETVQPLQMLSQDWGLKNLTKMIANRLSGEDEEGNAALGLEFLAERDAKLVAFVTEPSSDPGAAGKGQSGSQYGPGVLADVEFVLDDGSVLPASRALVTQRSSFMAAMLCGTFQERWKRQVPMPDLERDTLAHCLHFLYVDKCPRPRDMYEAMDVLAAADRLCLPRLMELIQEHIIGTYLMLGSSPHSGGAGAEAELQTPAFTECLMAQRSLELLEPAEAFHGHYLYTWCLNFIATHYVFIYRHHLAQLRSLSPHHQAMLAQQRWPPVWYISEYDLYEQSLERRRQEMLSKLRRKRRSRFSLAVRRQAAKGDAASVDQPEAGAAAGRANSEPPLRRGVSHRWRLLLCSH